MAENVPAVRENDGIIPTQYSSKQIELVREVCAKGCSETEFLLMMQLARTYGLDPFARQIWCVRYGQNPAQIFCGRDGYLAIAHRSGQFDGMESGTKEVGGDIVGWCRVYRKDMSHPFEVEVQLKEYSTGKNLWLSKPRIMIQKVAESSCLRRAFSISGLYAPEEFDTGDREVIVADAKVVPAPNGNRCEKCGITVDTETLDLVREHTDQVPCRGCFRDWWNEQQKVKGASP